jgi:hypothetical protein
MVRNIGYMLALLLLLICTSAVVGDEAGEPEREIRSLEAATSEAIVKSDRDFFEKRLADDFTHTSHAGRFVDRARWLADLKPGQSLYQSYAVDDLAVRVYGDTAVTTGRASPAGTNSKRQPITGQYRFSRV